MKVHEVCSLFPEMSAEEFEQLKADIKEHGQKVPVELYKGQIIDGRNRYKACKELGIDVETVEITLDPDESLTDYVVALNLHRRHLSASQRAAIAVEIEKRHAIEAKERQREGARKGGSVKPSDPRKVEQLVAQPSRDPQARDKAAAAVGVNRQYVQDAKKISQTDPHLFSQLIAGQVTLPQAKRQIRQEESAKVAKTVANNLPVQNIYRVLYADPPWQYSDSGDIYKSDRGGAGGYGKAEHHYATLSIEALCNLGPKIRKLTADNAVLFLWVTSPMLQDCFEVIGAWGFKYKASFVWDKVKHNFGHYNSVRHEFLLICTKGSCTPDEKKLVDSVVSIERGAHSEKPSKFRNIISDLYTRGKKIELFHRGSPVKGWDTWGIETGVEKS